MRSGRLLPVNADDNGEPQAIEAWMPVRFETEGEKAVLYLPLHRPRRFEVRELQSGVAWGVFDRHRQVLVTKDAREPDAMELGSSWLCYPDYVQAEWDHRARAERAAATLEAVLNPPPEVRLFPPGEVLLAWPRRQS